MKSTTKRWVSLAISVIVAILIMALVPTSEALTVEAVKYLGIFVGMIILLLSGSFPDGVVVMTASILCVALKVCNMNTAFGAWSGTTTWLLIPAFAMGIALAKSGLFNRIALHVLAAFPQTYRSQVLAQMVASTIISPTIPSNLAKASIMAPFSASFAKEMNFAPGSNGACGLFSAMMLPIVNCGHAFYTGSALVGMIIGYVGAEAIPGGFSWMSWFKGTIVWFLVTLILSYLFIIKFYPAKVEVAEDGKNFAREKLNQIGPMTRNEKLCAILVVVTLALWMTTSIHGLASHTVAIIMLFFYVAFDLVTIQEISTKVPWGLLLFIVFLMAIPGAFTSTGLNTWLSDVLMPFVSPFFANSYIYAAAIAILVFLLRYIIMAQNVVMILIYVLFGVTGAQFGYNPWISMVICVGMQQVWCTKFANSNVLSTIASSAAGGQPMVEWENIKKMSYGYALASFVGVMVSVPVWQLLGLMP